MIEIFREWKSTWNPIAEAVIGTIIVIGGYTVAFFVGSIIADMFEKDDEDE